jgi:hypothetical protein
VVAVIAVIDGVVWTYGRPVPENLGRCYELAGKHVIAAGEGAHLIHGTIQAYGEPPLDHAWIERADGSVWEPATATTYPGEAFAALFNPVVHEAYSVSEAARKMVVTMHFGPWED